jgi:hypothetical protein
VILNDPFELPSLEEWVDSDCKPLKLEVYGNSVKCQTCGIAVPVVDKLTNQG